MIMRMYAVLDKAVSAFLPPFCMRSEGEAIRSFQDAVSREGTPFNAHKSDFSLCYIGTYDDSLGQMVSAPPSVVAEAATVLAYPDPLAAPGGA